MLPLIDQINEFFGKPVLPLTEEEKQEVKDVVLKLSKTTPDEKGKE